MQRGTERAAGQVLGSKWVSHTQVSPSELFILCHSGVLKSKFMVNHPKVWFAPLQGRSSLLGHSSHTSPLAHENSTCGLRGSKHLVCCRCLLQAKDSTCVRHRRTCSISAEPLKVFPSHNHTGTWSLLQPQCGSHLQGETSPLFLGALWGCSDMAAMPAPQCLVKCCNPGLQTSRFGFVFFFIPC